MSMGHDARALELALYSGPSISAPLVKTGSNKRPQKRYDHVALIVAEIAKLGYESEGGRKAQRARID